MRFFLLGFLIGAFFIAEAQRNYDVIHYKYELQLTDSNDIITGTATIYFKALENLSSIDIDLGGQKQGKGMHVSSIYEGKLNDKKPAFSLSNEKLSVRFNQPINKGDERQITILYTGIPSDGLIISKNKYGDRTFFADNWPNRAHFWIPCKDVPNDKASFEFIVTAPSPYKVVSNGIKIDESNLDGGKKRTYWRTEIPLPTKVMVIGAAKFAVKEFPDNPPNVPVSAWVYQQDSAKGFHDYAPAVEILKFFSSYIGPYPYEKLANVQSKTIFGGMENASAIFYAENSVTGQGGIEDLLAHEIAHQWFGDMASEKSFAHLWLSEGFATYFTNIFWQYKYGDEAFRKRLQNQRNEVIEFAKSHDHPVVDSLSSYMDLLNANSYQKGAWVLHMLRNEVGDSIFHNIVQSYYQQYKGGNADTRDFQAVAEKVSGKNLKWFFDQWLYQPDIPKLNVNWKMDGNKIKIEVKQTTKPSFQFPLEIGIVFGNGKMTLQKLFIKSKEQEFKVELSSNPAKIILDPNTNLLFEGSILSK